MIKSISLFLLFSFSQIVLAQNVDENHQHIVLRAIGHELLVQSGEKGTRVLPINKINENTYQIKFEKEFAFVTDTLINTVDRIFRQEGITSSYQVLAKKCKNDQKVYAYEIVTLSDSLIPCSGVVNPKDCYLIEITFIPAKPESKAMLPFFILFAVGGLFLFLFAQKKKKRDMKKLPEVIQNGNILIINGKSISLSEQETKLYQLLNESLESVVERETLLHEIWEKEGTIVTTRSLDVLVSKLRKKLAIATSLQITNVHGKGYKLTKSE